MGDSSEASGGGAPAQGSKTKDAISIEKMYQKKSQLEHILLRPDTYIGSVEKVTELMWVYDTEKEMMVQRDISYVPGLYKIFDEILVNAADNKQRDPKMDCIKITISPEDNLITIWNNGKGIPVVEHKDEKMFVPTMIFGHLLTSSNYNDEEEKVTGGRNGYGAKLCNIFSNKFIVETSSKEYKRAFKQSWSNNMGKASDVKIKDTFSDDYTKISFSPDLSKFKMDKLDKDIVDLMSRRAFDVAASTRGVKVFLNGTKLPVKSFKDYVDLYIKNKVDDTGASYKIVYESAGPRWEVAITCSEKGFQQVSFVNSIATTKGGRHVDHVVDMIVKQVVEQIKKKNKSGMDVKPFQVKNHMWIFVNCLIVNPTFDSQTKEHMTLQVKNFGSKCSLSEKFMTSVVKSGLVENVLTWAKFKAQTILEKTGAGKKINRLKGVPKLEDANEAGTKTSLMCTLILTEGDSAKTLAVSGLSVIGRDRYGVFPLRGKLLNVREASHRQIIENAEINNIIKIMGLQYKKKYETHEDMTSLRYGKIMIMTDQDQDGSHIKGLIVNFIHFNWPSLIRMNFLEVFITPLVKAFRPNDEISFFSLPEFEEWKQNKPNWKSYRVKYYKGLGTSTSKEAKEYFSNMERHRVKFKYSGPECDQHIIMAFSKKHVEQRKEWLTNWMHERKRRKELGLPEEYLYTKETKNITFKDFINKELVLFSNMDNERSIPSMVDGFKPGQRKVLYTCLKRNDKREIKVAQLAGSVAEHSAYHHGEVSLMSTIINMAQNYVGSNNINLLQPIGQFGTRLQGGKDSASPRYIFTKLSPLARLIFHPDDDPILKYQFEDNQKIEPIWYIPILPMLLVNGADGIGTGWMTKIPNFNPRDICSLLKKMIEGEEPNIRLNPWYKGFKGDIEKLVDDKYVVSGEVALLDDDKIEITELPIGTWTQNYKESVLEVLLNGNDKTPAQISNYKEYNTDTTVKFIVQMDANKLIDATDKGLHIFFKLQTSLNLSSMCAFDKDCCLRKYESVMDMFREFYDLRVEYYQKRKDYLVGMTEAIALKLHNQARFILEKCSGQLTVENKKKAIMIKEMKDNKYAPDPVKAWKDKQMSLEEQMAEAGDEEEEEGEGETSSTTSSSKSKASSTDSGADYDYLLGMPMWNLTMEKKEELIDKRNAKQKELDILKMKVPGDFWKEDLDNFLAKLEEVEKKELEEQLASLNQAKANKGAAKGKKRVMTLESVPSPQGRRVAPTIGEDLKKKVETAIRLKERKLNKQKAPVGGAAEEKDEFDLMEEAGQGSLESRLGNSPRLIDKKMKEKKRAKKESPVKAKKMKDSFSDFDKSSSETESPNISPVRQSVRKTVKKFNYNFSSESEEEEVAFSSDDDDKPKKAAPAKKAAAAAAAPPPSKPTSASQPSGSNNSDNDSDVPVKNGNVQEDSNKLFDSLLGKSESDSCVEVTPPKKKEPAPKKAPAAKKPPAEKKPPAAKKKAPPKKQTFGSDSDSDSAKKPKKAAAKRTKKKGGSSDSESSLFSSSPVKPKSKKKKGGGDSDSDGGDFAAAEAAAAAKRATSSRARKPISYKLDDEDSDF